MKILISKNEENPKNSVMSEVSDWFEWARKKRIVLAMSGGVVYTPGREGFIKKIRDKILASKMLNEKLAFINTLI